MYNVVTWKSFHQTKDSRQSKHLGTLTTIVPQVGDIVNVTCSTSLLSNVTEEDEKLESFPKSWEK